MTVESAAVKAGVADVFVLHQVTPGRLVNVDGYGRGAGWAGNIDVDPATEPWLAAVLRGGVYRTHHGMPHRVFGPYWTEEAAGVVVGDHIVAFGGKGVAQLPEEVLRSAARSAMEAVDGVPVAKRLADELEVSRAALEVARLRPRTLEEAATAVATAAARATSCEFGAVLLHGPPMSLHLSEEGWRPSATHDEILAALLPLAQAVSEGLLVEQDTAASPLSYRPLAFEDGLVARCGVPIGEDGSIGLLVVAHSIEAPRGFTLLCQRVMRTIAVDAAPVIQDLQAQPL